MSRRLLIAVPLALVAAAWFYVFALPWPVLVRWRDPGTTAFIELRKDRAHDAGESYEVRRTPVPLERISRHLQLAVILAEDGRFREHNGIDWIALAEELRYDFDDDFSLLSTRDLREVVGAIRYYIDHRHEVRGRSTISQQLAKNLYFTDDRSLLRKLDELIVVWRLELFLPKDRILELYLNVAEWGPGIFGAESAAHHYFGRSAADLTANQAAALAGTLPHPLTSNPAHRPARMQRRQALILELMRIN
ncbi:MAG TPA: biosynthetic peptidoglycan transglycosylase [Longimicrobiales bacterium]|nr:biosynthetic peptidoglycan transglycosylase [Longimicrobiales bacterium]